MLVGGTNGKGSCSSTLATILTRSGRRTGLFTSPHLTRFGERFLVDGAQLPDKDLLSGLAAVRPLRRGTGGDLSSRSSPRSRACSSPVPGSRWR